MYIYKLLSENNELLYIGITNNIKRRIYQHSTEKEFAYCTYSEVAEDDVDCVEAHLIYSNRPKYNKHLMINLVDVGKVVYENSYSTIQRLHLYEHKAISEIKPVVVKEPKGQMGQGRPKTYSEDLACEIRDKICNGELGVREAARTYGLSVGTVQRIVKILLDTDTNNR